MVWFSLLDFCFLLKKGIDSDIPEVERVSLERKRTFRRPRKSQATNRYGKLLNLSLPCLSEQTGASRNAYEKNLPPDLTDRPS